LVDGKPARVIDVEDPLATDTAPNQGFDPVSLPMVPFNVSRRLSKLKYSGIAKTVPLPDQWGVFGVNE
jgi:hypothetical protein